MTFPQTTTTSPSSTAIFHALKISDSRLLTLTLSHVSQDQVRTVLDTRNRSGMTPLQHACVRNQHALVHILVAFDPTPLNTSPELSPMLVAAYCGHLEIMRTLARYTPREVLATLDEEFARVYPSDANQPAGRLLQVYAQSARLPAHVSNINKLLRVPGCVAWQGEVAVDQYLVDMLERASAMLMGTHPRIGHRSPLRNLTNDALWLIVQHLVPR
eukprot:c3161_g1_i2.p1 GENE.c3161_g1_i2~~c3161_g1_i2.p1  ORF type:complete len:231 (+),score=29.78 c3161_g1_i2:50-694(+)